MAIWLKQSTAVELKFGPFVDSTDAVTAETGLTISQADVRLAKNDGDWAQKNESTAAAHEENGNYRVLLDTTDTNTLGRLRVHVAESGALPVWQEYMVVPANVWDSFFGADALQVHAVEIANALITAASIASDAITAAKIADGAIDAATFAANAITSTVIANDAITDAKVAADVTIASVTGAVGSVAGAVGSVTGAVGSVTGNVGGNVVGTIGSLGAQAKLDVNAEVDTALTDYDPPTRTEATSDKDEVLTAVAGVQTTADAIETDTGTDIPATLSDLDGRIPAALSGGGNMLADLRAINGDAAALAVLEALMDGALLCQVNDAAATTTAFAADGFTEATDDHFNGRLITFVSGALRYQQTDIADYDAAGHAQGSQAFVVSALTEAPANNDFFVIQ